MPRIAHARRAKRLLAFEQEARHVNLEYRYENDIALDDDEGAPKVPSRFALISGDDDGSWITTADTLADLEAIAASVNDGLPWKAVDLDTGEEYEASVRVRLLPYVAHVSFTVVWTGGHRARYSRGFTNKRAARQYERFLRGSPDHKNVHVRYRETKP